MHSPGHHALQPTARLPVVACPPPPTPSHPLPPPPTPSHHLPPPPTPFLAIPTAPAPRSGESRHPGHLGGNRTPLNTETVSPEMTPTVVFISRAAQHPRRLWEGRIPSSAQASLIRSGVYQDPPASPGKSKSERHWPRWPDKWTTCPGRFPRPKQPSHRPTQA